LHPLIYYKPTLSLVDVGFPTVTKDDAITSNVFLGKKINIFCYVAYPLDLFEEGFVTNMFTSIVDNAFQFKALHALHLEDT